MQQPPLPPTTVRAGSTIMQEVLLNGNSVPVPVAGPGKTGMMAGAGGVIPPALLDESRVPRFYHEAIVACGATNTSMLPHTALVYNLMVTSGLPRHTLSYIWSAVNRTLPGQLTRAEFYSCLALIALAQKEESIAALSTRSQLPIPYLQAPQVPAQQGPPLVMVQGQQGGQQRPAPSQKPASSASRFIPTSFLSRLRPEPKKEVDLIGGLASPSTAPPPPASVGEEMFPAGSSRQEKEEQTPAGPNYDLSDVDWDNVGSSFGDPGNSSSGPTADLTRKASPVPHCSVKQSNWEEAVRAAVKLFRDCEMAIGKSAPDVLLEVFETEKGSLYLRSLHAVSTIISRISKTSAGALPREVAEEVQFCTRSWQKYQKFLRPDTENEEPVRTPTTCPICQDLIQSNAVEFGTRTYHSTCANLWVNCVRPALP